MNEKLLDRISEYIENNNLLPEGSRVVLGLSGGPDSIFLLNFLAKLSAKKLTVIAAHLDHQWREESAEDLEFCRYAAEKLNVYFVSAKASELDIDIKKTGSLEEQGRIMRRHFLETVMHETKADCIALAHHADDQEETFFIRLIRGTTLTGLSSMRPRSGPYIRPLLKIFKKEIVEYLDATDISYLIDPSNEKPEFLRNRIRQTVLPALRACDARFDKNFIATLSYLQDAEDTLAQLASKLFEEIAHKEGDSWCVDGQKLLSVDPYLRNRILLHWLIEAEVPFTPTEKFLAEIVRFLEQPGSKDHAMHTSWGIRKKKDLVMIYKI